MYDFLLKTFYWTSLEKNKWVYTMPLIEGRLIACLIRKNPLWKTNSKPRVKEWWWLGRRSRSSSSSSTKLKVTTDTEQLILSMRFQSRLWGGDNRLCEHSSSHKLGGNSTIRTTRIRVKFFSAPIAIAGTCSQTNDHPRQIFYQVSLKWTYIFILKIFIKHLKL